MKDKLTTGKPFITLFLFALPMIISVTLQQLYNICDSAIAGKFISDDALASITSTHPITMVYLAIATGFGVGVNIVTSRFLGENKNAISKKCIYTSILTIVLVGAILSFLCFPLASFFVKAIRVEDKLFSDALLYLRFFIAGVVFLFLYNVVTSIFQALGNSKIPLYFLIFSTCLNIALDLLFVVKFDMGVKGLAIATFIAQMLASLFSFIYLIIYARNLKCEEKLIDFSLLKSIIPIALPSILQAATISIGQIMIQSLINTQSSEVVAGYGAAYKLSYIMIHWYVTVSNAIATYTSRNAGAKEYTRIKQGFASGLVICAILTVVACSLFLIMPRTLLSLFVRDHSSKEVLDVGCMFIYTLTPFFFTMAIKIPCDGVLKGSKDMFGFMLGTMIDLIVRVLFAYILFKPMGMHGVFWSWPIGWFVGVAISLACFVLGRWKRLIGYNVKQA